MSIGLCVDLGCGTGLFADECRRRGLSGCIVGVDLSFDALLFFRKKHYTPSTQVQADIEHLSFRRNTFDTAVTASTLQWLKNLPETLKCISSTLKEEGLLGFSVFVEGSFHELFSVQRRFSIPSPVQCPETTDFIRLLEEADFRQIEHETVERTVYAASAAIVLKGISGIGGTATAGSRLLNRREIALFCSSYEKEHMDARGVPLTYRALVGTCRKRLDP